MASGHAATAEVSEEGESSNEDGATRVQRKRKRTKKGTEHQLSIKTQQRNSLRRKCQGHIANLETLLRLNNPEPVANEIIDLNILFVEFGNVHEECQELLKNSGKECDNQVYDEMFIEVSHIRQKVNHWIVNAEEQNELEAGSKYSRKTTSRSGKSIRSSKSGNRSTISKSSKTCGSMSSVRAKAIEAKARQAELEAKITQLDRVEAAKKEANRIELEAKYLAAAAASKVYNAAVKEEDDQYLGSDDPDQDQKEPVVQPKSNMYIDLLPTNYNSKPPNDHTGMPSNLCSFFEKLEIRMTQPSPRPTPFSGDPSKYLQFKANFKEIENRTSLSDFEKMNYLLSYTTGKAKGVIENYQGLPHGCRLALQVLEQRFGQPAMIVQSLKNSIMGPKIRDSTGLLEFADKLENCCFAMEVLQCNELDCTTNLRLIYNRLPESLQRKWRKQAKLYRQRTGGREPALKELTRFLIEESEIENDPVYGKFQELKEKVPAKTAPQKIPTLVTDVKGEKSSRHEAVPSHVESCVFCESRHRVPGCPVFLARGVSWRRRAARENKLCYRCLSNSHLRDKCPEKVGCNNKDCSDSISHHSLLHIAKSKKDRDGEKAKPTGDTDGPSNIVTNKTTMDQSVRNLVLLKVVPVKITSDNGVVISTYALLDSASVSSLITCSLAEKLQLQGIPERVSINTVTHNDHKCELNRVHFKVSPVGEDVTCFTVYNGLTVDDLNISSQYCPDQLDVSDWSHLSNLDLPSAHVDVSEVSVLIGQDVPQAHVVLEYVWGDIPQNQPYAMKTPFGWSVAGPAGKSKNEGKPVALSVFEFDCSKDCSVVSLEHQVEQFWATEKHGFTNAGEYVNSVEDDAAVRTLESTTKLTNGRYEVGLLWKNAHPCLPNNRRLAEKRLQQLKRKFDHNDDFAEQYKSVMNDYIEKGYAKKLTPDEAAQSSDHTWYLPHHGVVNPNKSKVRVVYDAAAEYGGTSLNRELFRGPQLTNLLLGVLLRFRKEKVAVASDIESMFHRVACRDVDTDALRFLWWSEDTNEPPSDHKMMVHLFGKADSPCIAAWALQQTAIDNESQFGKEVAEIVKRNFYVDDCLYSKPTVERAAAAALQLISMLRKGNFRLTKFTSNAKEVLAKIPAEDRTTKNLDLDKLPVERALGMQWDVHCDRFSVKAALSPKRLDDNTRRGCLSTVSSTFDPFGIVAPVVLPAKRILQKTWQRKLEWDERLPDDLQNDWRKWKEELPLLNQVSVPRCLFKDGCSCNATFQLHHFADASEHGYGTASYLRKESANGSVECSLIIAKSRTAPLQYVSVPRLELQAATIAVRIHNLIMKEIDLDVSSTVFWTDSKITLQYIKNETRRFKTYVANRVAEIRDATQPSQWRHCPGGINPADDASRGLSASQLIGSKRWFNGPAFLMNTEDEWPDTEISPSFDDEAELRTEKPVYLLTTSDNLSELLSRYSSWMTLIRKVAWLLKFKSYLQERAKGRISSNSIDTTITPDDLEKSTIAIIKLVQRDVYGEEIRALESQRRIKNSSDIAKLNPVLNGGVLRVGGRIPEAPVSFDTKYPIIVPTKHHVTRLLIASYHQSLAHAGQNHILSRLREKYWIPRARSVVRRVVRSCLQCRKQRAKSMEQMMSALPAFRTTAFEPCFTHTGVDYFGPMNVKRGRSVVKRWGALFTCLNSRAVHLDLASSLEADCFINVLRRFINRRGPPKCIYSDNGTNFVGAQREISEAIQGWNHNQIQDELLQKECKWIFQPPSASHASGVWERLIRSTRTSLKAILGEGLVDEETLTTVLTEVESILNSRPLCPVSDDPNDCEPLTPNHLLLQRRVEVLPPGTFIKEDIYLRKKWRHAQLLADHFWKRWLKEYIPCLQERQKWLKPRRNANVGDLVLLIDHSAPRGRWHLGRIEKLLPGKDGLVRTVMVKTKSSTLMRPIQKLCLLEEAQNLQRGSL